MHNKIRKLQILFLLFPLAAGGQTFNKAKFKTSDFKYSVYLWHINLKSNKWDFYLASYLHIDSSGSFELLRHTNFSDKPKYFRGTFNEGLRKRIDSVLIKISYLPNLKTDNISDTPLMIYDGFTYLLDYKLIGSEQTKIQYINASSKTPKTILRFTSFLDSIVAKTKHTKCDSFSIGIYLDTLKKISSNNLPPVPIKPSVKYESPKIK